MAEHSEQVRNVLKMEQQFISLKNAVDNLEEALSVFRAVHDCSGTLEAYYTSPQWRKDFEDDEAGLIIPEISKGVLSEDGIYNLLDRKKELLEELSEFLNEIKK